MNPNRQFRYGSMVNSQRVWIGWVVSGSPNGSIHRFNSGSFIWSMWIVPYQNRIFNKQGYVFACCPACNINWFGIGIVPLKDWIFVYAGTQLFRYEHGDQCYAFITKYATTETVDAPLTLIFRMPQGACRCCFCQWRLPIFDIWMSATNRKINDPTFEAKNHWRSVDAHSQNAAASMLL